jgi:uncharacterized protein YigA (DUF484 family)
VDSPTLLGIAAVVTALGGLASTVLALRRNRTEEHEHALKELAACRAESERLAKELHELKMRHGET